MNYRYLPARNIQHLADEDVYIDNVAQDRGVPFQIDIRRQKKDDLYWSNHTSLPRGGNIEFLT